MTAYVRVQWEPVEQWIPTEVLVELDDRGFSIREVGFDQAGNLVHRCPDQRFREGRRGFFDDYPLLIDDPDRPPSFRVLPITGNEFEAAYAREIAVPVRTSIWTRLRQLTGRK